MKPTDGDVTGATARGGTGIDLSWESLERDEAPPVDWKKRILLIGLGLLSWVATYVGMLELIEANMGELPLVHKAIIGFSVAMLMVMIVWLLDQMFRPIGWTQRLLFVAGYVFLTVISVGFGFGFYWKVLESRSVATSSATGAVGQVQTSMFAAQTRLEQLQGTFEQLVTVSRQKADFEKASGTSCPASRPGDGPRRRLREEDAQRFGFAADLVKGRVGTVKGELGKLDGDLTKIAAGDPSTIDPKTGTRNEFMKSLSRKLDMTVAGFNAFRSDPQIRQLRTDLAERADRTTFPDGKGGTFQCPDQQLQAALRGVVRAIDELPALERPKIVTVEGSEAVIEAFRRLTTTFYGALSFKLPPTAEEVRELQRKAVEAAEAGGHKGRVAAAPSLESAGLSKRDYIPLAIALFVDLCLLLVSIGRSESRLGGLMPRMREAERGPVIQILSRFNQIHRDAEIRENFEIFRHVVFDFNGDYYVAVPLDAPPRMNPAQREELRLEAALLANLFASFEQERLFSRVLMPLLPMSSIRKKLRRQGSKFAEAEAFRVYKFRNGAWSEIILGAVMGAARRVEGEKRRRRIEEDVFRPTETPTLATGRTGERTADPHARGGNEPHGRPDERPAKAQDPWRTRRTEWPVEPESVSPLATAADTGTRRRARRYGGSPPPPPPLAEATVLRSVGPTGGRDPIATPHERRSAATVSRAADGSFEDASAAPGEGSGRPGEAALVERFGRYARFVRAADGALGAPDDVRRAPSSRRRRPLATGAANTNGAESATETETERVRMVEPSQPTESNVIVLPAFAPAPPTLAPSVASSVAGEFVSQPVTVAATERTVTFTMPAEQLTAGTGSIGALAREALSHPATLPAMQGIDAGSAAIERPALSAPVAPPAAVEEASTGAERRRPGPPPLPTRAPSPALRAEADDVDLVTYPAEDPMTLAARRFAPRIPAE